MPGQTESLSKSLHDRLVTTVNVAACLAFDAALLAWWLLIAWALDELAQFMAAKGVHELAADAFKWASSIGTLILTILYIIADIVRAFRAAFQSRGQEK